MFNSLRSHWLYSPWNYPGQNTGVDSHSLLQGTFPTQGSKPGLLHCRRILYHLSRQGSSSYMYLLIYALRVPRWDHISRAMKSFFYFYFFNFYFYFILLYNTVLVEKLLLNCEPHSPYLWKLAITTRDNTFSVSPCSLPTFFQVSTQTLVLLSPLSPAFLLSVHLSPRASEQKEKQENSPMIHFPKRVHKNIMLCFPFEQDRAMQTEVPGTAFNTHRFF